MANQAMQIQARAMKALRMRLLDRGVGRPQRGMMLCVAAQASSVNGEKDCEWARRNVLELPGFSVRGEHAKNVFDILKYITIKAIVQPRLYDCLI